MKLNVGISADELRRARDAAEGYGLPLDQWIGEIVRAQLPNLAVTGAIQDVPPKTKVEPFLPPSWPKLLLFIPMVVALGFILLPVFKSAPVKSWDLKVDKSGVTIEASGERAPTVTISSRETIDKYQVNGGKICETQPDGSGGKCVAEYKLFVGGGSASWVAGSSEVVEYEGKQLGLADLFPPKGDETLDKVLDRATSVYAIGLESQDGSAEVTSISNSRARALMGVLASRTSTATAKNCLVLGKHRVVVDAPDPKWQRPVVFISLYPVVDHQSGSSKLTEFDVISEILKRPLADASKRAVIGDGEKRMPNIGNYMSIVTQQTDCGPAAK